MVVDQEENTGAKEVLILTQEELVVYPAPSMNSSSDAEKVRRFPLSQILSNNDILFLEKVSAPGSSQKTKDFILLMTSDLVIHTIELTVQAGSENLVNPNQIKLVSSHDTRNVVAPSQQIKLKKVIQSAVLQFDEDQLVFILFDNFSFMVATIKDAKNSFVSAAQMQM